MIDAVSGTPVVGALIVSGSDGRFWVSGSRAGTILRIRKLGYRPFEGLLNTFTSDVVQLTRLPSQLTQVVVRGASACDDRQSSGVALSLWEQTQAALVASTVAAQLDHVALRFMRFKRYESSEGRPMMELGVDSVGSLVDAFEVARPVANLLDSGFVRSRSDGPEFLLPDTSVLSDPLFLAAYCLSLDLSVSIQVNFAVQAVQNVEVELPTFEGYTLDRCRADRMLQPESVPLALLRVVDQVGMPVARTKVIVRQLSAGDGALATPTSDLAVLTTGDDGMVGWCGHPSQGNYPMPLIVDGINGPSAPQRQATRATTVHTLRVSSLKR